TYQCPGAVRRKIEPAEKFEPSWFGGAMQLRGGRLGRRAKPGRGCGIEPAKVGPETGRECLEKGNARAGRQLGVALQDVACQRYSRGFATFREQVLAQLNETGRTLLGN